MKSIAAVAMVIVAMTVLAIAHAGEPGAKTTDRFVRPFPIVGIARSATDAQKIAAKQIADAIGVSAFTETDHNPTCCVWIEVTGWTPNPGEPGYVIINQGGGSIISASDDDQLKKAVERFENSIRKGKDGPEVPTGLMTSYRIAAAPQAGR